MQHMHMRTGQHPFGGQTEFCLNGKHKLFVKRPRQGEKNNNVLLQSLFFDRLTCPLLLHPKCISCRWILVPFGDAVSQTNVLSFARIIVVSVRMLGGQLPPLPRPPTPIPYAYVHMPHVVPKLNRSCNPPSILRN